MDYKKLYEETIEKVKGLIEKRRNGGLYVVPIKDIEDSIPELKESEDERIRKELIEQVVYIIPNDNEVDSEGNILPTHQKRIDKYRAWLEKQDEKKHTDIVKPKFHEGEWVVFNDKHESVYQIEKIENFQYTLRHVLGGSMPLSFGYEDMIRAWTIADAKDGDVLYDGNAACIFRKTMEDDDAIWIDTYCGINIDNEFKVNDEYECWCISSECSPATKEQRDLLFKKMHEAGYEWDAEKKELKKIEQKPAWRPSEEQMASITCAVRKMKESACYDSELVSLLNDLNKLKEESYDTIHTKRAFSSGDRETKSASLTKERSM